MNYVLDITDIFRDDLLSAVDYLAIELDNFSAAERLELRTTKLLHAIADNPFLYPLYHDNKIAAKGYRYVTVGSYLLFYTVDENKKIVRVARFIYGKRNVGKLL